MRILICEDDPSRSEALGASVAIACPGAEVQRAVPVTAQEPGGCASQRGQVVALGEDDVIRGARPQRRHRGCGKVARADDQHRELGVVCTQGPHQLAAAVTVYEPRADDGERRRGLRDRPLRRRTGRAPNLGVRAGPGDTRGERLAAGRIVVEDQDAHRVALHAGRRAYGAPAVDTTPP